MIASVHVERKRVCFADLAIGFLIAEIPGDFACDSKKC